MSIKNKVKSLVKLLQSPSIDLDKLNQNLMFRRVVTRNFSSGKIALGERNTYSFPLDWIRIDWENSDYNINLVESPFLPFKDNSQNIIYSAHMIEHLSETTLPILFKECYRVLKPGGSIRLEAPDAQKLIELYQQKDEHMLNYFRKFRQDILINKFGYPECYIEDHLSVLGEISNYIVKGQWVHVPVYTTQSEFEDKLKNLSFDEFCNWCILLQTPEQHKSGGHQSAIYFSKLSSILENAGFSQVMKLDFGKTNISGLKLNDDFWSIKEKSYRSFYSLFVEAIKPK